MKNKIILLLILLSANILLAQNEQLKVIYGQYPIGTIFEKDDLIISLNNIEPIILISQTQGLIILRERGKWQANNLYQQLIKAQKNNLFPELFIGEINPKRDDLLKLGNVERCLPPEITPCLPINSQVFSDKYTLKWLQNSAKNQKYQIRIVNDFDETLDTLTTQDTLYQINLNKYDTKELAMLRIIISKCNSSSSGGCGCPLVYVLKMSNHKLKAKFQAFIKSLKNFPPALAHLYKGLWFYQNEFYFDAFQEYSEAHKLLPKSKALYFVLGEFLARHSYHWTTVEVFPNWRKIL